jgi:ATP-dependent helicase/nuclease subunit B
MERMAATEPTVFTIPAGLPFVDALAAGILARAGEAPEVLADATVLLPTRRACRSLREAFLRRGDGPPLLLPRMMPLGDVDEDELALTGQVDTLGEDALALPPAISGVRRQMLLARLVLARPGGQATPEQAARLAA